MNVSENSRVWIYQSSRFFNAEEESRILNRLEAFVSEWQAHGSRLVAAVEIKYHLFIILSVDEEQAPATGCSIDRSVNLMKDIEHQFDIKLFDRFQMAYRDVSEIKLCSRNQFAALINSGVISHDTIVFNNLVHTRKALQTDWEIPLYQSWHMRVFKSDPSPLRKTVD